MAGSFPILPNQIMRALIVSLLLVFGLISLAQAGRKAETVDEAILDLGAIPASFGCSCYNDLYWRSKSGCDEWGWAWSITRSRLQREMSDRWQAENPGLDDPASDLRIT